RKGWQQRLQPRGNQRPPPPFSALQEAVDEVFEARIGDVSGRGKLGADMREIWMMQPRFDKRVGTGVFSLVEQPRFRAGFDFLRLRAQTGEIDEELAHWWETFSTADDDHRQDMVDAQRKSGQARGGNAGGGGKVRRVKKTDSDPAAIGTPADDPRSRNDSPAPAMSYGSAFAPQSEDVADGPESEASGEEAGAADAPPRKRRRRRRKPSGGGGAGSAGTDGGGPAGD
ncbi:MAG: hypothetical protein MUF55_08270, partial [Hydrogenophaga sp.]|nr:hypothetical protein [Hydrogenophaga sp.]